MADEIKVYVGEIYLQNTIVLWEEGEVSMKQFGTLKVPETYVFDRHGKNNTCRYGESRRPRQYRRPAGPAGYAICC